MSSKILFIDDDEQWVEAFLRVLQEEGYDVVTATNATDALEIVNTPELKLVITDLMLPERAMDTPEGKAGIRLLESIRIRRPGLPIIVLSAYLEPYAKELENLGVTSFTSKGSPNSIQDVRLNIRRALENNEGKVKVEIDDAVVLSKLRKVLAEEIDKYSPLRERTIYIPEEGSYELIKPLIGFKRDIERQLAQFKFSKNVFLMMKFRNTNKELSDYIIETLSTYGLRGVRADHEDWNITKNVYNPIAVLYCCKYGIALFDEPEEHQAYSANVAYELGMMHYQNKHCLILRHSSLPIVPFDLIKDLYMTYERDLQVRGIIASWVRQIAIGS